MNLDKLKKVINHPKTKKAFKDMKPKKSIWGFLSVVLLFILPEIIAFIYGDDITKWCESKIDINQPDMQNYLYENIELLFGEGSWFNLILGVVFLIWLFF